MRASAEYRAEARNMLRGKWRIAIMAGFVAALFGWRSPNTFDAISYLSRNVSVEDVQDFFRYGAWRQMGPTIVTAFGFLLLWRLAALVVGGMVYLGYARFNLRLSDRMDAKVNDLFSQLARFKQGFLMKLLLEAYLFLWTLLLILPGIIMGYAYAMTPYILCEHPEMTANEAIRTSKRMMDGKKWNLLCLHFSFIGWGLLCDAPVWIASFLFSKQYRLSQMGIAELLTAYTWLVPLLCLLGAGNLVLMPYRESADAAFYQDLKRAQAQQTHSEAAEE